MAARGALGRVPRVPRPAGGTARADRARRRATGAGGAARSRCPSPLLPARRRAAAATGALARAAATRVGGHRGADRKSTRLNSSHLVISYAVFCLKKKKKRENSLTYLYS